MEKENQQDKNNTLSQSGPDQTRRRLTGSALGAGVIFTLSSSPVLAGGQCLKPSGFASGNLSSHTTPPPTYCKPPEHWCQSYVSWPSFCKKGSAFHNIPFPKNGCGYTFYKRNSYGQYTVRSCYEVTQPIPSDCTNRDLYDLGRYCLAACLSISENPNSIPCMNTGDIMTMWNDCTTNGRYEVTAGKYWSIQQCRDYIKSFC